MRKLLFAGAVAGGFLLLGGAPAHADVLPMPAGTHEPTLADLLTPTGTGLDPAGGINLDGPFDSELVDVKPGTNTPDVDPSELLSRADPAAAAPEADVPQDQPPGRPRRVGLPAAGMAGSELSRTNGGRLPAVGSLPVVGGLLGGGLLGGLPTGGFQPDSWMPVNHRESGLAGSTLPGLDGIAGLLPGPATPGWTPPGIDPADISGMPPGGVPVDPANDPTTTDPTTTDPTTTDPATTDPDPAATDPGPAATDTGPGTGADTSAIDDDKRLHEEPVDDDTMQRKSTRAFSADERPVTGDAPGSK